MSSIPIFTELLATTGLGHFMRCTALYDAIEKRNYQARFVLRSDGTADELFANYEVDVLDWTDPKRLETLLNTNSSAGAPAFAIVDSYLANSGIYERLARWTGKLICIDDALRIEYPSAATIVNPGIGSEKLPYDRKRNHIIAGARYALLRKPFRDAPERREVEGGIARVLITTGGEDRHGIVPKLMRMLRRKFERAVLTIIVGPAFRNREEIEAAADEKCELLLNPSANILYEAMRSADLAVTAGGQTTYELARLGVPMIQIRVAENQRGNIAGMVAAGAARDAGAPDDARFESRLEMELDFFSDSSDLENASRAGMRTIDGQGANRIVQIGFDNDASGASVPDAMQLRPVVYDDALLLLEWANDPSVRAKALSEETIEEAGHLQWLRSKLASPGTRMYIMSGADAKPVGQIRFDRLETGEYEVSFSIEAGRRGEGLGKLILRLGIERLGADLKTLPTLRATVKRNNPASAKTFLATKFSEAGESEELLFFKR